MTTFRVRMLKPEPTRWQDIEADTAADAAMELHERMGRTSSIVYVPDHNKPGSVIWFALVEVEGCGEVVSRLYRSGIVRRGGVKTRPPVTLSDVAKAIGWSHSLDDLVSAGWDGEREEWT